MEIDGGEDKIFLLRFEMQKKELPSEFPRLESKRRQGSEQFSVGGRPAGFSLLEYWQWSASEFVSNATRGCLAEFIVAKAMGIPTTVREEWAPYDLATAGPKAIKNEMKSAAYLQTWNQKKPSSITFSIRPARVWNESAGRYLDKPERSADVYVFALLAHLNKVTIDPLDLDQWEFYVLPTEVLSAQKTSRTTITLNSLRRLGAGPIPFACIKGEVEKAVHAG